MKDKSVVKKLQKGDLICHPFGLMIVTERTNRGFVTKWLGKKGFANPTQHHGWYDEQMYLQNTSGIEVVRDGIKISRNEVTEI